MVYGVLYVVMEMIGHQLEQVGWSQVSALDVATAVTDAFLTVAICGAVLLALELGAQRWQRFRRARAADEVEWDGRADRGHLVAARARGPAVPGVLSGRHLRR